MNKQDKKLNEIHKRVLSKISYSKDEIEQGLKAIKEISKKLNCKVVNLKDIEKLYK